jgi:hypothetical protein
MEQPPGATPRLSSPYKNQNSALYQNMLEFKITELSADLESLMKRMDAEHGAPNAMYAAAASLVAASKLVSEKSDPIAPVHADAASGGPTPASGRVPEPVAMLRSSSSIALESAAGSSSPEPDITPSSSRDSLAAVRLGAMDPFARMATSPAHVRSSPPRRPPADQQHTSAGQSRTSPVPRTVTTPPPGHRKQRGERSQAARVRKHEGTQPVAAAPPAEPPAPHHGVDTVVDTSRQLDLLAARLKPLKEFVDAQTALAVVAETLGELRVIHERMQSTRARLLERESAIRFVSTALPIWFVRV